MKKINLNGISEILSNKELKNVVGGSGGSCTSEQCSNKSSCNGGAGYPNNNYCVNTSTLGCRCASAGG
jgi:bacteriocin-like protein